MDDHMLTWNANMRSTPTWYKWTIQSQNIPAVCSAPHLLRSVFILLTDDFAEWMGVPVVSHSCAFIDVLRSFF